MKYICFDDAMENKVFSRDSDGVNIYSRERDIYGAYDNVYVPYTNLEALVFYFSEPPKEE